MTHNRNVVSNGACLFCLLYICLLCIELDIFCLGHQRLSLRLDTSDSSKEGLCCNLCAPLVVESHLQANSWAERHQASSTTNQTHYSTVAYYRQRTHPCMQAHTCQPSQTKIGFHTLSAVSMCLKTSPNHLGQTAVPNRLAQCSFG